MRLSRRSTNLLRLAVAIALAFIYIPLIILAIYAFNASKILEWPPPGLTLEWFPKAFESIGSRGVLDLDQSGPGGDDDRAGARHPGLAGGRPLPLLRTRDDLLPGDPPDRAAGNRDRGGAEQHLHPGIRDRPLPVHRDRRPRDLLHRRRLQQRRSPGCGGCRPPSRRRRPTSGPTPGRRSATSPCPTCARRSAPAACSPSASPSTRSSSPRSRSAPAKKRFRSGSSRNLFRAQERPIVNAVAVIVVLISIIPVYIAHRLTSEEGGAVAVRGGGKIEGGGVETEATAVP